MNFGAPELLALLLILPLLGLLLWRALAARERAMRSLLSAEAAEALGAGAEVERRRRRQARAAFWAVAFGLVAATGPQLGFVWQQQKVEGVTLAAVLDVSRSMQAQDVLPSRMEVARRKLGDLSRMLRGDAIGLVIFARGAWLRLPPTVDYDTFRWALADSEPAMIRAQGTSLAGALTLAVEMLARAEGSGKAIVLISDGEAHDDQAELQAVAAAARAAEVRIYAIGVGTTDGAPIPLTEGGFKEDGSGNLVVSRADPEILKALASATGGAYVPAVPSEEDVRMIYEQEIRSKLQAAVRGVRSEKVWQERYQWPLSLAFFVAIWGSVQGIGRRRGAPPGAPSAGSGAPLQTHGSALPILPMAILLAILLPLSAQAGAADGLAAWRAGRFDEAIRLLGQARVENPADVEVGRALAESLYRTGRYQEAESLFRSLAAQAPTAEEQAAWTYNAGNAAYRAGRLQDALSRYEEAGRILPSLDPASQNAEMVREEIRRREQQEQQQQEQQQQEQQGQGQQQEQQEQEQQGQGQQQEQEQQSQGQQQEQQGQGQQQEQQQQNQEGQQGQEQQQDQQDGQQNRPPEGEPQGSQAQSGQDGEGGEQSDAEQDGEAATQADPVEPGGMSKEEAARLVESVPDGRPQGVIGGASDGRDW